MFIGEEKVRRDFVRYRNGKPSNYFRIINVGKFICDNCKKEIIRRIGNEINRKRCNNDVSHFCSTCPVASLAGKSGLPAHRKMLSKRIGEKSLTENGYVRVYVSNTHPFSNGYCGSILEHVLVMENHLGRALIKGEVVHHIDGNKTNNDIQNLDLLTVQQHNSCHGTSLNTLIFELFKERVVIYNRETKKYERRIHPRVY